MKILEQSIPRDCLHIGNETHEVHILAMQPDCITVSIQKDAREVYMTAMHLNEFISLLMTRDGRQG